MRGMEMKKLTNLISVPLFLLLFFTASCETTPSGSNDSAVNSESVSASNTKPANPWPFFASVAKENGAESETDVLKKNYYVIFDNSGSMNEHACKGNGSKMHNAKIAMREFVKAVPQNANLGIMTFTGEKVQLGLGNQNRQRVSAEVEAARPETGTPLHGAIKKAYAKLTAQGRRQLSYGEYHLVIVTDGEYTDSDPAQTVNRIISESPVVVYTIGFCIGNKHSLNQPGRTEYREANDLESLRTGLKDVLAESEKFDVSSFQK